MRGKHSGASMKRRAEEAEERVRWMERAWKNEKREHAVTKRIAERVERMEEACKRLEMQNRLATNGEVERLTEMVGSLREEMRQKDEQAARIQQQWERVYERLSKAAGSGVAGMEFVLELMTEDGKPVPKVSAEVKSGLDVTATERIQRARGVRRPKATQAGRILQSMRESEES